MHENVRSVQYRYSRDSFDELPGPVDKTGIRDYRHIEFDLPFDPIVLLKQLDCYAYQSCECPDWSETDAHAFCQVDCGLAEATLPTTMCRHYEQSRWSSSPRLVAPFYNSNAYDDAPWGPQSAFLREARAS